MEALIAATTATLSGLCSGTTTPVIIDANGCITNQTVSIVEPTQLTANGVVSNLSCNSVCNGSINLTPTGGTLPYTYSWTPAGGTIEDPLNLCAGNYTVDVTDANNCVVTNTFVITQPATLTLSFNKKDVLCNSNCTGGVRAVVGGGASPYTYTWTPLGAFPGSNLDTLVNLCSGDYTVTATDINGCTITGTINIGQPSALTSTITSVNVKCSGQCNGSATITASGGTGAYTYDYNTTPITPTQTIGGLCSGSYTGTATDANGCVSSNSFVITEPLPIVVTTTISNPKCNAVCNGSVATTVTGGNPNYSYNWIPNGGPVPSPTGLCAGSYTVVVTDDSLCTGQALVVLTDPIILISNISFTNSTCNLGCNGIATANPIGGTAPFSYSWATPVFTTQTISNLCAGSYTLTLTDANLCQDVQVVTLTDPPAIAANPALIPASCGFSDGSINATAVNGVAPYTYNWLPPVPGAQSTNTLVTNLAAGVYTVIITDAATCSVSISIPLNNADGPSGATITSTNVTCQGQCNGIAEVANPVVGGTAPYTLSWLNSVPASTLISNLCAGTYTAQIADANNCLFFQSVAITEPQSIDDNEVIVPAACFGNCNGSISLNPSGGNAGAYTYSWSPAANTGTVSNLCPGVYTATVTDVLGCTLVANYNLPGITTITSSTFATNNTCFGNCNGTLLATNVAGGVPQYTYSWSDPIGQNTSLAVGLCSGNYSVTITDANGCFNVIPAIVTSPSQITFTPNVTAPSCDLCNGSALINPVGGTPGYTYLWSASNQTTSVASNLCAGVYVVQITDGNGCVSNSNVIINSSSTITGETISLANVSCGGTCDGTVTVTAIGGNGAISYHWVHNGSTSQTLNGLCAGTYFCNMTDINGCSRTASVVIGAVTDFTITPTVTQSSCLANTGSISVAVVGGTGVYTYAWLPAGNTATVSGLAPGIYTLTVSDVNCSQTQVYTINSINGPMLSATEKDISCNGVCDGSITLTVTAGTPGYTTLWSNAASTTSISSLCAGAYSVEVTDAAGCKAVKNFSLNTTSPIIFSTPDLDSPTCANNCNGSLTTIPIGGTLPYTYSWTPVAPSVSSITGLCAGDYSVIVVDANACAATETFSLINPPTLTLTATITDASCNTALDGAITTTVSGGVIPYSYTWTPGNTANPALTNVLSGTYTLTLSDNFGCVIDSSFIINSILTVNALAGNDTTFCQNGTLLLDGSNSNGGTSYDWFEIPLVAPIASTLITSVSPAVGTTTYVLMATNGACVDRDTVVVTSLALPTVDAGPTVSIPLFSSTAIGGNPTGAAGGTFTWSPVTALDNPSATNPTSGTTVTTIYTVTVMDVNGCLNSDTVTVFVYPEIRIPNGFSPNGDGKNDVWEIDFIYQFPDCEVEVYNRWGEQLFYSKGYSVPFNGQYKGKDLPVGTYYYIINLNHPAYPDAYTSPLTIFR
jgi:gliding motility-associated-like protein